MADYERMLEEQHDRCAACGDELDLNNSTRVHIDHCHDTGMVRSLLCRDCNTAAGMLADSHERDRKLARYLRKWDKIINNVPPRQFRSTASLGARRPTTTAAPREWRGRGRSARATRGPRRTSSTGG